MTTQSQPKSTMPVEPPVRLAVIEDWTAVNRAIRRKAGLPEDDKPSKVRDPEAIVRAEARKRRLIGTAIIMVAFGLTVLLCAYAFKWTPAITARELNFPSLRLHPDDLARLMETRVPIVPAPPPGRTGDPAAVTNYVVFQNVAFANGVVVTGWRYATNTDTAPSSQYCYYEVRGAGGVAQVAFLENADRRRLPWPPGDAALGLTATEWNDAMSRCRWFTPGR